MATQSVVVVQSLKHLEHLMHIHQTMVVFFEDPVNSACLRFKGPLYELCVAHKLFLAVLIIEPRGTDTTKLPFVNLVQGGKAVRSLFEAPAAELRADIVKTLGTG